MLTNYRINLEQLEWHVVKNFVQDQFQAQISDHCLKAQLK